MNGDIQHKEALGFSKELIKERLINEFSNEIRKELESELGAKYFVYLDGLQLGPGQFILNFIKSVLREAIIDIGVSDEVFDVLSIKYYIDNMRGIKTSQKVNKDNPVHKVHDPLLVAEAQSDETFKNVLLLMLIKLYRDESKRRTLIENIKRYVNDDELLEASVFNIKSSLFIETPFVLPSNNLMQKQGVKTVKDKIKHYSYLYIDSLLKHLENPSVFLRLMLSTMRHIVRTINDYTSTYDIDGGLDNPKELFGQKVGEGESLKAYLNFILFILAVESKLYADNEKELVSSARLISKIASLIVSDNSWIRSYAEIHSDYKYLSEHNYKSVSDLWAKYREGVVYYLEFIIKNYKAIEITEKDTSKVEEFIRLINDNVVKSSLDRYEASEPKIDGWFYILSLLLAMLNSNMYSQVKHMVPYLYHDLDLGDSLGYEASSSNINDLEVINNINTLSTSLSKQSADFYKVVTNPMAFVSRNKRSLAGSNIFISNHFSELELEGSNERLVVEAKGTFMKLLDYKDMLERDLERATEKFKTDANSPDGYEILKYKIEPTVLATSKFMLTIEELYNYFAKVRSNKYGVIDAIRDVARESQRFLNFMFYFSDDFSFIRLPDISEGHKSFLLLPIGAISMYVPLSGEGLSPVMQKLYGKEVSGWVSMQTPFIYYCIEAIPKMNSNDSNNGDSDKWSFIIPDNPETGFIIAPKPSLGINDIPINEAEKLLLLLHILLIFKPTLLPSLYEYTFTLGNPQNYALDEGISAIEAGWSISQIYYQFNALSIDNIRPWGTILSVYDISRIKEAVQNSGNLPSSQLQTNDTLAIFMINQINYLIDFVNHQEEWDMADKSRIIDALKDIIANIYKDGTKYIEEFIDKSLYAFNLYKQLFSKIILFAPMSRISDVRDMIEKQEKFIRTYGASVDHVFTAADIGMFITPRRIYVDKIKAERTFLPINVSHIVYKSTESIHKTFSTAFVSHGEAHTIIPAQTSLVTTTGFTIANRDEMEKVVETLTWIKAITGKIIE